MSKIINYDPEIDAKVLLPRINSSHGNYVGIDNLTRQEVPRALRMYAELGDEYTFREIVEAHVNLIMKLNQGYDRKETKTQAFEWVRFMAETGDRGRIDLVMPKQLPMEERIAENMYRSLYGMHLKDLDKLTIRIV